MGVDPQTIINSRLGVGLSLWLGRVIPAKIGYRLANTIARQIALQRDWRLVRAVRLNQWMISGKTMSGTQLDQAVLDTFQNTARCLFDLYHNLNNENALLNLVNISPAVSKIAQRNQFENEGLVVVGIHLSNFDLILRAGTFLGWRAQVISIQDPGGGYQWQNDLRRSTGLQITPASKSSLRDAISRLQAGGVVLTGIDRPLPSSRYRPCFFGEPSLLPVMHISLALKAKVPVMVLAARTMQDGTYLVEASDPIYMRSYPDRDLEILKNAEAVLNVAASFIRQAPEQWSMFYPVWPENQPLP